MELCLILGGRGKKEETEGIRFEGLLTQVTERHEWALCTQVHGLRQCTIADTALKTDGGQLSPNFASLLSLSSWDMS
jgi:hypothetical protein